MSRNALNGASAQTDETSTISRPNAQVGLVRPVLRHRLGVRQPAERRRHGDADLLEDLDDQRLHQAEHQVDVRERDLDVHLRELGLPVGAQVLVAKALHDLEVAIHPRDHQDLLEDLRRLRQREELARMDAARHQIVARAFGRRLRQNRRLDLPEAFGVEILADRQRDAMPQAQVVLQARAAQIEIAIAQPHVFADRRLVGDRELRRLRLVQQPDLRGDDLDLAGIELRVHRVGVATAHRAADGDDVLGAQLLGGRHQRAVVRHHHLREPVPIAHVEEQEAAEIADAMDPAEQDGVGVRRRPDAGRRRCGCGRGSREAQT